MVDYLALDPGGTTGWAHWRPGVFVSGGQIEGAKHHKALWGLLANAKRHSQQSLTIIAEQFGFRKSEQHRDKIEYVSREYLGVAQLFQQTHVDVKMIRQEAAVMTFWDDEKLAQAGVYTKGQKHRNDAVRHLLWHVSFTLMDNTFLKLLK